VNVNFALPCSYSTVCHDSCVEFIFNITYKNLLIGLECYCYNEPNDGLPICYWEYDRCTGDVCYIRKVLHDDGILYSTWNCLRESVHHIDLICDGAFNTATEQYICCSDRDNCNENIEIELPIERPQPVSTNAVTSASGSPVSSHPTSRLPSTSTQAMSRPSTTTASPQGKIGIGPSNLFFNWVSVYPKRFWS
jgi:hypothetical protein